MGAIFAKRSCECDSPVWKDHLNVYILGLESAGKTTVLRKLKKNHSKKSKAVSANPHGFCFEKIRVTTGKAKGTKFLFWDFNGKEAYQRIWRSRVKNARGIIFVLDSADIQKMDDARMEIKRIVNWPGYSQVPILVLANKQDLVGAWEPTVIEDALELHGLNTLWNVQPVSAIINRGIDESIDRLYELIQKHEGKIEDVE